jgi:hypothetical protein
MKKVIYLSLVFLFVFAIAILAFAKDVEKLAKDAQNPIADLISLPFENNFNFKEGLNDDMGYIMNIKPVVPFHLNEDWNLIGRGVLPVVYLPAPTPEIDNISGLSDFNFQLYLTPENPGKLILGIGPSFTVPTATDDLLGSKRVSMGPCVVALTMPGKWVLGVLVFNEWSLGRSNDNNEVNSMLLEPFVNYNFSKGWYLSSSPIITVDWTAESEEAWMVPLGGGVGRVFHIGPQAINASLRGYYNVAKPTGAGDWTLQLTVVFLFPEK